MSSRVTLSTSSGCSTVMCSSALRYSSSSSSPLMTYPHVQLILYATPASKVDAGMTLPAVPGGADAFPSCHSAYRSRPDGLEQVVPLLGHRVEAGVHLHAR